MYAFNKYDGSNIRLEWSKKRGWYKFGTKKMIIDENHEVFGNSIKIFLKKYADDLHSIFTKDKSYRNSQSIVVFCEYVGENSFAGFHNPTDEMDMVLFDVSPYKKGLISPKQFINDFGHLHIPELIYQGNLNNSFIQDVKENKFNLKEGVVCKGLRETKGNPIVWMVKIKTQDWLDKIKNKFGEDTLKKELAGLDII